MTKQKNKKRQKREDEFREQHTKAVDKIRRKINELEIKKKRQGEDNKRHEEEKKKQDISETRERARQKIEDLRKQLKKGKDQTGKRKKNI